MGDSKTCQNPECQRELTQKPREGKYNFWKRKTCNKHCANKSRMLNHNIQSVNVGKRRKFSPSKYPLSLASEKCYLHECGYIVDTKCPWYTSGDVAEIWRTRGICKFYQWSIEDGQTNTRE